MIKCAGRIASSAIKSGNQTTVIIDTYGDHVAEFEALEEELVDIQIKKHRDKRSKRANALCWELCSQIGNAIRPPLPKEEVYRHAIRDVGVYEDLLVREDMLDAYIERCSLLGIGWFVDIVGDAPLRGWTEIHAYHGSSSYNTQEMAALIDYLVDEATQMELQIGYDLNEIERIKDEWAQELRQKEVSNVQTQAREDSVHNGQ